MIHVVGADVDAVVAEVARDLTSRLPALTDELTGWFTEVIPEFRTDEAVRQLMVASTSSNMVAILDMLTHAIPLESISVPPAAAEYARRFAQHELSLEALLRAYRLGEHRFSQWTVEALGRLPHIGTADALAAVSEFNERLSCYIDQVIEGLIDIYESERRRWNSRTGAARSAQLRAVLDSDSLSEPSAEELLGVPLGVWHQAAIAWVATGTSDPEPLLQAANRILNDVSGRTPLTMLADGLTLWAWVSAPTRPALDGPELRSRLAAQPALRMTLGAPGAGLAGFRASHREAVRARRLAETAGGAGQLLVFDEVAVPALLAEHPDDLRNWTARVLGGLCADDPNSAELRRTVQVFLQHGGSFTEAAARLHLHKNTVHYRVKKAEQLRGRPLTDDRLDVEVALLVCDALGLGSPGFGSAAQTGRDSS
jgi:PucR C-terminal helix-turn-helix domain/GGDEF-like domain